MFKFDVFYLLSRIKASSPKVRGGVTARSVQDLNIAPLAAFQIMLDCQNSPLYLIRIYKKKLKY
jgi:hypothetical protein